MDGAAEALVDTWRIHNRINLYLLDAVAPEALADVAPSKGRSVAEAFAHLHNVRIMWLNAAAPELLEGLEKIEKGAPAGHAELRRALEASGAAIEALLARAAGTGKVKGFKPHATAFLGYLISHESHHRGQIAVALKASGHPLERKVAYGIWEWGVR
ncbi:MAG TPA: DinB family protein [Longimicrobiaceae bacterium]|nr:DinB family protein [Longimicrobiaceae bacterium]